MSQEPGIELRREFDVEDHDRLTRIEERLASHIRREDEMEQRWCRLIRDNQEALMTLADEFSKMRVTQAERNAAEKALLWAGGLMFTAGSGMMAGLAWLWDKFPNGG